MFLTLDSGTLERENTTMENQQNDSQAQGTATETTAKRGLELLKELPNWETMRDMLAQIRPDVRRALFAEVNRVAKASEPELSDSEKEHEKMLADLFGSAVGPGTIANLTFAEGVSHADGRYQVVERRTVKSGRQGRPPVQLVLTHTKTKAIIELMREENGADILAADIAHGTRVKPAKAEKAAESAAQAPAAEAPKAE